MINSFPKEVVRNLKYYIYLLIDPFDNSIFYVGKGQGNRVFSHFKNLDESNRSKRINDILKKGLNPKIEILVHRNLSSWYRRRKNSKKDRSFNY